MLFQNSIHVFEDLDKEDMVSREKGGRIGGRGMPEHHGKEYIGGYKRWH
jgi:molybdenum-dependent DNA-binding transcriptional regulator ModE